MSDAPKMLDNGAEVLAYTQQHPGGNGYRRHGVALCHWPSSHHPFVTWTVYQQDDGSWGAESGHYFMSVVEAGDDYRERVS